jgi:hypothetical protein
MKFTMLKYKKQSPSFFISRDFIIGYYEGNSDTGIIMNFSINGDYLEKNTSSQNNIEIPKKRTHHIRTTCATSNVHFINSYLLLM